MTWNNLSKNQALKKINKMNITVMLIEKQIETIKDKSKIRDLLVDRLECLWDLEMYYNNEWDTELFFNNNVK